MKKIPLRGMFSRHLVIGSVEVAVNRAKTDNLLKQITCERGGPLSPVVVEGNASGQTLQNFVDSSVLKCDSVRISVCSSINIL